MTIPSAPPWRGGYDTRASRLPERSRRRLRRRVARARPVAKPRRAASSARASARAGAITKPSPRPPGGAESIADDLGFSRGVVLSRAAASLRSIETKPSDCRICPPKMDTSERASERAREGRAGAARLCVRRRRRLSSPLALTLTLTLSAGEGKGARSSKTLAGMLGAFFCLFEQGTPRPD